MTPSSGLEVVAWRVKHPRHDAHRLCFVPAPADEAEPLVTAASAQARIAELEAEKARLGRVLMTMQEAIPTAYHPNGAGLRLFIHHLKDRATVAEARADRLAKALERIERSKARTYGHLQSVARAALQQGG